MQWANSKILQTAAKKHNRLWRFSLEMNGFVVPNVNAQQILIINDLTPNMNGLAETYSRKRCGNRGCPNDANNRMHL